MSEVANKPTISIQGILDQLAAGVSRKDIAKSLGVSFASAQKNIFNHPKLRNRKTISAADFTLIDDAPDAPESFGPVKEVAETEEVVAVEETVEEVAEVDTPVAGDQSGAWRE